MAPTIIGPAFRAPAPASVPEADVPTALQRPGDDGPSVPVLPLTPREIARALAGRQELWQPAVRFTPSRFYTRIATGPSWEAWLLTWLPGQSTGLHDHGGSAGAFAVLAGHVDEDVPLGAQAGRIRLLSRRHRAGQVRAFGSDHVHDVAARGGRRAITLHVYSPRLTTMTRYELQDGALAVTVRERAGEDW